MNCGLRAGFSLLELFVAFTLLAMALTFLTSAMHRHNRLLAAHRDYRLALDELTNQLDRLTALPFEDLPAALENLPPSAFSAQRLPGAELRADLQDEEIGRRIILRLTWSEPKRGEAPVVMAAWVYPGSTTNSLPDTTTGGDQ
jgi:type II secretory pathway component PulJ